MGPSNGSGEPRALSLARLSGLASGMPPQAAACALGEPCHEARHAEFERVPPAWLRCLTEFGVRYAGRNETRRRLLGESAGGQVEKSSIQPQRPRWAPRPRWSCRRCRWGQVGKRLEGWGELDLPLTTSGRRSANLGTTGRADAYGGRCVGAAGGRAHRLGPVQYNF